MQEFRELIRPKAYPCDYFPCLRAILTGDCAWKVSLGKKVELYIRLHLLFEIRFFIRCIKLGRRLK